MLDLQRGALQGLGTQHEERGDGMSLEILTGFDGNGPASQDMVRKEAENRFVLMFPKIKEKTEDFKGARLETRLRNSSAAPRDVQITVDMPGREKHLDHLDVAFIRHDSDADWTMVPGSRLKAHRALYCFRARPGVTELAHCPAYGYDTCAAFVEGLKHRQGVNVDIAGHSVQGRDVWVLDFPSSDAAAPVFFIQARDHAYESAGSYCVEGMAAFLLSDDPLCRYLRHKFRIVIMPMTNPDGVALGALSMTSDEDGANVEWALRDQGDAAIDALRATVDSLQPKAHINIHNFVERFTDAVFGTPQKLLDLILDSLPADTKHHKRWRTETLEGFWKRNREPLRKMGYTDETRRPNEFQLWTDYTREQYGASAVAFEFPWFARTGEDMRQRGRDALVAVGLAAIELQQL